MPPTSDGCQEDVLDDKDRHNGNDTGRSQNNAKPPPSTPYGPRANYQDDCGIDEMVIYDDTSLRASLGSALRTFCNNDTENDKPCKY